MPGICNKCGKEIGFAFSTCTCGDIMFRPGDKVTYLTEHKKEHGIVKSISNEEYVFVVYHCNDEWENYENYTAARTRICDLVKGWK